MFRPQAEWPGLTDGRERGGTRPRPERSGCRGPAENEPEGRVEMGARPNELTAVEAARRIETGELSVEALVRACLERIEEREPEIAAWAHLDREQALAAAIAHDGAGPMRGVPVGVKDVVDTVDAPTTYGSPIYRDHWPGTDAVCVHRIHAAGGIVLGKTVTTEFAARYPGPTRNPRDVRHTPGGSSSGSAAAVADCMAPLGIGTQTAGSVIRPAAFCGVYGYKPTFGRFSFAGVRHYAESVDTLGCMARSVEDLAFFRDVLLGVDPCPPPGVLRAASPRLLPHPPLGGGGGGDPAPPSRTRRSGSRRRGWPSRTRRSRTAWTTA